MGGVTDSQTVIRRLKSVFSGNDKKKGKHIIFTLFTTITPMMLLLIAGLVFWQRMENEHINCYAPPDEDIRVAAVNQYCFITGTYTVVSYPKNLKSLQKNLPYPGIGPRILTSSANGGTEVKYLYYFQWVPFVLGILAMLFVIPDLVWKSLRKDTLSRYRNSITSSENEKQHRSNIKQTAKRFLKNLKHHSSFSGWFIASEILNLVVVILAIHLSDLLLTGEFLYLGRDWISYMRTEHPDESTTEHQNLSANPLDLTFPKMSKCEFKKFGPTGSIINYDLLCVMTLNVFHDKVFLFLWFWFLLLVVIQTFNLIYQFVVLRISKVWQYRLILERIEPAFLDDENAEWLDKHPEFKGKAKAFLCSLSYSDWFLLRAIAASVDIKAFSEFFQDLVKQHGEQEYNRKNYNHVKHDGFVSKGKYPNFYDEEHGGKGLIGWKSHGTPYNDNIMYTLDSQNESKSLRHVTRNRNQRQSLYSNLNESLREMRQEVDVMEEKAPLVNPSGYKNVNNSNVPVVVPKQQPHQQTAQHSSVDVPDGNSGQESDRNENFRENLSEA